MFADGLHGFAIFVIETTVPNEPVLLSMNPSNGKEIYAQSTS